ncbi:hypothetical protein PR048_010532 [Dryococelus australis]|uniref:Pol protein n=1 Tax=Dryococelus australis TaxID=614101 RepID=A0ABQ9I502_9NEOP|nr:hypothetical protein PR048_010532 [Dryococelus australis]
MKVLVNTLRIFCHMAKQSWRNKLPRVEFLFNNTVHESTKCTPWETVIGQSSAIYDPIDLSQPPRIGEGDEQQMENLRGEIASLVRQKLHLAAEKRARYAKQSRINKVQPGQLVLT